LTNRINYSILFLAIVVLALAGSIIRFCQLDFFTITFYRLIFAFLIILPFSYGKIIGGIREVDGKKIFLIFLMGVVFSLHFFTWIYAVQNTTIANASICLSLVPVFVGIGEYYFFKVSSDKSLAIAIIFGVIGSLVVGINDLSISNRFYMGDLSAFLSSIFFAIYFLLGKKIRKKNNYFFVMSLIYFFAAFVAFTCILYFNISLSMNKQTFGALLFLAFFPTVFGHGALVYVCKYISPTIVSTMSLLDSLFSGFFAYLFF